MTAPGVRPTLTVVVASPAGSFVSTEGLDRFRAQLDPSRGDELLVERGENEAILVPELWSRGLRKARGEVVAFTLASMSPDPGWAEALLRGFLGEDVAGVGGAIEPGKGMRILDWAIHLCRYSAYLLPFEERDAEDLAGDNAAYRRGALEAAPAVWADSFWETEVDAGLRLEGQRLSVTPAAVVRQAASAGFASFCRNRFRHGIRSGRERAGRLSFAGRLSRAIAWPLAAWVLLSRIGRRAAAKGRAPEFRRAMPRLLLFLLFWAAGEAVGYLRGR